jgi:hypothetical protein
MPLPDFFIVGAFKSGTTALYDYLREHPQVYMPFHKEPLYFGDDLTRRYGRMTRSQYESLFAAAEPGQRVGEASAWYLYSRSAAQEIRAASPGAQIIIMLRNPVDVMYAQHSQLIFNVEEDIEDFAEALEAEPARRRRERLPPGPLRVENLYYRESVRFADQVQRYYDAFGRERVLVLIYDDFSRDTAGCYRQVLEFLGVDPTFAPDFSIRNPNKRVRFPALQRLVYQPPGRLLRLVPVIRRFPLAHAIRDRVLRLNSSPARRKPMDPALRGRLLAEFEPEIRRLGQLVARDLSAWLDPANRA